MKLPSEDQVQGWLYERSNWGRWGKDDQRGALNLITPEKRVRAARLVKSGESFSLSLPLPVAPGGGHNTRPVAQYFRGREVAPGFGALYDYFGIDFHGHLTTHLDAMCHYWGPRGMWQGREPFREIALEGAKWATVDHWKDGYTTRGVLLDVPKVRGQAFVDSDSPVHGEELEAAAKAQGVVLEPGDALLVYMGREAFDRAHADHPWAAQEHKPGMHASCLPFLREHDVAILLWDMMDAIPSGYSVNAPIHAALFAYGMAIVDNVVLEPLASACARDRRYEFLLSVAPLYLPRGTGSPVNPVAIR